MDTPLHQLAGLGTVWSIVEPIYCPCDCNSDQDWHTIASYETEEEAKRGLSADYADHADYHKYSIQQEAVVWTKEETEFYRLRSNPCTLDRMPVQKWQEVMAERQRAREQALIAKANKTFTDAEWQEVVRLKQASTGHT